MNVTRAWILALLMAGACLPARAQRKIVETAPGTVKAGPTNVLRPDLPAENRGGGLFDRLYKPNSIQLAPMETAPSSGSATSSKLDPALQKRLIEEQSKRKNWAVENAARMNRGDSMIERRRSDTDGRRSGASGREPTAAELNLQAVDPKYARQFKENTGNPTEVSLERARLRADQQRQKRDGRKPGETDASDDRRRTESEDPNEPSVALDSRSGSQKSERELDRWDKLNSNANDSGKAESPLDRAAARLSAADTFDTSGKSSSGDLDLTGDTQRQERLAELSSILGEPTSVASDGLRSERSDSFISPTRSGRASEFQRLLAPESAPTLAPRTGGDAALSGSGDLSRSVGASAIQRDLPGLSAPSPGFNFNPAGSTPALAPATPRMAPRPIQLPVPVRGKGGF